VSERAVPRDGEYGDGGRAAVPYSHFDR
jgi:hypothetical protein